MPDMKGSGTKLNQSNELYSSKLPDQHRQKISSFKPKTLNQIYQQNKCKKDDKDSQQGKQKIVRKEVKDKEETIIQSKNSLQSLIQSSGRSFQVQSLEMDNSEFDDEFDPSPSNQFEKRPATNKYQTHTPQYTPFSKSSPKESNPFVCKDDANFKQFLCPSSEWNGKIAMTNSVTYQEEETPEEKVLKQNLSRIDESIRPFLCKGCHYVDCQNEAQQTQFLLEKNEAFLIEELKQQLYRLEAGVSLGMSGKQVKKSESNKCIIFTDSEDEESYFLNGGSSQEEVQAEFEKHLVNSILPVKKYVKLYYRFNSDLLPSS